MHRLCFQRPLATAIGAIALAGALHAGSAPGASSSNPAAVPPALATAPASDLHTELGFRLARATGYLPVDDATMAGLHDLWSVVDRLAPNSLVTIEAMRDMIAGAGVTIFDAVLLPDGVPLDPVILETFRADVDHILREQLFLTVEGDVLPMTPWVDELLLTAQQDPGFITPLGLFLLVHSTLQQAVADVELFQLDPEVEVELRIGEMMGRSDLSISSAEALGDLFAAVDLLSDASLSIVKNALVDSGVTAEGGDFAEWTRYLNSFMDPVDGAFLEDEIDAIVDSMGGASLTSATPWWRLIVRGALPANPVGWYIAWLVYMKGKADLLAATCETRFEHYVRCMKYNCEKTRRPPCKFSITVNGNWFVMRCTCPATTEASGTTALPLDISIPWKTKVGPDFSDPWGKTLGKNALCGPT